MDAALNPLLDLLGRTLLTTPSPSSLPRLGELWSNSWQISIACYVLLVAAAGVVLMAHGSVQTRYSAKELVPRIPLGFLIAGLSLFLAGKAVGLANALSAAVMGEGVDTGAAAATLQTFVLAALNANTGSLFFVLIGFAIAGTLAALLVGYAVRLTLTVILIAGAPLALMCHALPQTEGIARWWWRAFGGVLAIQVVQSLALITALRLFLSPNAAFAVFGGNRSGLVDLLVALSLFYVLFKIPFWILGSVRGSHGRSLIGGLVRTYVVYRTFGALRGRGGAGGGGGSGGSPSSPFSGGSPVPGSPPPPSGISPAAALRRTREGARLPRTTSHGSAGYRPRRAPLLPSFRAPVPTSPAGAGEPACSNGSPPPPSAFRGPGDPPSPDAPPRPWPRPTGPPGPPAFRAPLMHSAVPLVPHSSDSAGAHTSSPGRWPGASSQRPWPPGPATFRAPAPENPLAARPLPPRIASPPATAFRAPPPVPPPTTPSSSRPLPPPPTWRREQ
ncbi:hypothetical protein ACTWJ8_02780 [Streptomyces sp. SDT5-1]|uniref:hypothetical protein n=1 Tax=Streptomyces sp. SDT5-1 TaxID=3406418 RepID=UPI003FCFF365